MNDAEIRLQCLAMSGNDLKMAAKMYEWVANRPPAPPDACEKPPPVEFSRGPERVWRPMSELRPGMTVWGLRYEGGSTHYVDVR